MAGIKGKGGVKGRSGGARNGSGRPASEIVLSEQARQELRIITSARGIKPTKEACTTMVESLIHEKWIEYDEMIQNLGESKQCSQ